MELLRSWILPAGFSEAKEGLLMASIKQVLFLTRKEVYSFLFLNTGYINRLIRK